MRSVATRRFWDLFHALPSDVQRLAVKNYKLWQNDPNHPSLRFRRLKGSENRFTVRIGDHYRARSPGFGSRYLGLDWYALRVRQTCAVEVVTQGTDVGIDIRRTGIIFTRFAFPQTLVCV